MKLALALPKVVGSCILASLIASCNLQDAAIVPIIASDDIKTHTLAIEDCFTCTYVVPERTHVIDGLVLGIKPGDVICLNAATAYKNLLFKNIIGSATEPVVI
jgi:hypothetical protein